MRERNDSRTGLEVAVIGMAGRFPGAADVDEFWRNLRDGVESISRFSDEELRADGVEEELLANPRYVRARGVLAGADLFDAELFGYSPREAEIMDPQQRIFLECAWEALEDAGHDPRRGPGLIGVYGGVANNSYGFNLLSRPDLLRPLGVQQVGIANDKDFLCSRVAYKLGLEGPCVVVQSACSTSLLAVHLACQALIGGECDMALAGGVAVSFPQTRGYLYQENGILSPDGRCRSFDARARGSVGGGGVAIIVLKRLEAAERDGDAIRVVIKGSATNNDGLPRPGYTAPRVDGQAKVIRAAHLVAEVSPETITYLEAHGSGTELGDPVEIAASTQAFFAGTSRRGFCAVGSVKSNVGHLDTAAGITGLIKTVLALQHGLIPPSLHFESPNPEIDFAGSPFHVNARLTAWPEGEAPRRAGVSSFGIGGTNVHVVLEEAPVAAPPRPATAGRRWQLLLLSGRSAAGLDGAARRLAEHLRRHPDLPPEDVAFTLQVGRRRFAHRRSILCQGLGEAERLLEQPEAAAPHRVLTVVRHEEARPVVFLLPGLGDHYAGMGAGLYHREPVFREAMDECSRLLEPEMGIDPRTVLFPEAAGKEKAPPHQAAMPGSGLDLRAMLGGGTNGADRDKGPLSRTDVAQPLLFAIEHSLARLLLSWGVRPRGLLGYSLGEYVAACLAGVLTLADALALVTRRARLIQELPAGRMLAVALPAERLRPWLGPGLWLAAINGPALTIAAGEEGAVAELEQRLAAAGITCRPVRSSHAFHTGMMQPIVPRFRELLRTVTLREPEIAIVSNLTGTWVRRGEVTDPEYWVRHLCEPVQLAAGLEALAREPEPILLEVGPGQSLGSLALQAQPAGAAPWTVAASLRHEHDRQPDDLVLLRGVAQLWLAGADLDWHGFHGGRGRRLPLPTHPFERKRYWIERAPAPGGASAPARGSTTGDAAAAKTADRADWFYAPTWKRAVRPAPAPVAPPAGGERWLLLSPESGPGRELAMRLARGSRQADLAIAGERFRRLDDGRYLFDPDCETGWGALFDALPVPPGRIVDLLALDAQASDLHGEDGFYRLLLLARVLGRGRRSQALELCVVTTGLADVDRGDRLQAWSGLLLGPLRVIPQELPGIACRAIDLGLAETAAAPDRLAARLLAEIESPSAVPLVALREARRWVPAIEPVRLESTLAGTAPAGLRQGGVYLITGGLGGLGLALAEFLAREVKARLALVGRTPVPERAAWLLAGEETDPAGDGSGLRRVLRALAAVEAAGAEVMTVAADVADPAGLRRAVVDVRRRFGPIDGVFHAAGVPGAGLIQLKDRAMAAQVLAPKVAGTLALKAALAGQQPDFLVLFSSLSAHLGGIGQVDYSAANAFLGAHAQQLAAAEDGDGDAAARRTLAIDWCEWQWDSWTGAVLDPELSARLRQRRQAHGLTLEEGMDALCRAMASHLPQVIVSTRDLMPILERQHSLQEVLDGLDQIRRDGAKHARPALGTPYVAPRREPERRLAVIWEELLGVGEVGVHDNFFQLGGHSLLGLQVAARVREVFAVELSLRTLFEAPTIAELTVAIEGMAAGSSAGVESAAGGTIERDGDAAEAAALLGRLAALSDEELDALLAEPTEEHVEPGGRPQ